MGAKTTQGLLQLIRAERNGDTVNRLLLAHLLRMLTALGIYQSAFQVGWRPCCSCGESVACVSHYRCSSRLTPSRTSNLQDVFLDQTREYYAAEGVRLMSELDVADYLLHCEVGDAAVPAPDQTPACTCRGYSGN